MRDCTAHVCPKGVQKRRGLLEANATNATTVHLTCNSTERRCVLVRTLPSLESGLVEAETRSINDSIFCVPKESLRSQKIMYYFERRYIGELGPLFGGFEGVVENLRN